MSILNKKPNFKPKFLFIDEGSIKQKHFLWKKVQEKLNNAVVEVNDVFGSLLSEKEYVRIMKGGYNAVISLLKERAGLPHAETEAFFKLTKPKDLHKVIEIFNDLRVAGYYQVEEFEFKNNRFVLKQESVDSFKELVTYHTTCEKANIALEVSKKLCEALNLAYANKIILSESNLGVISKYVFEKVISIEKVYPIGERKNIEFCPRLSEISQIRDNSSKREPTREINFFTDKD